MQGTNKKKPFTKCLETIASDSGQKHHQATKSIAIKNTKPPQILQKTTRNISWHRRKTDVKWQERPHKTNPWETKTKTKMVLDTLKQNSVWELSSLMTFTLWSSELHDLFLKKPLCEMRNYILTDWHSYTYIPKVELAGWKNPQMIWNFLQRDCLGTRNCLIQFRQL